MALEVRYSLRARNEEIELLEYIVQKFGQEKAKEIYDRIERVLDQISKMPDMYRVSNKCKGLKKCVFSKQTSIYYRIEDNHIEVVSFSQIEKTQGSSECKITQVQLLVTKNKDPLASSLKSCLDAESLRRLC